MAEKSKIVYEQWEFTDNAIKSGSVHLAMSLMSDALETNTFTATVECTDKNIINFERNTPLTYYYNNLKKGIFYVQSITRDGPKTYTIYATSAIGLLIEARHYGGIYTGQTVAEVLPSICGTVPYVVKTNLRDIALYGWLPVASSRDNLSQVLFAIGASIRTDLDGVLHIETLWDGIVGNIGKDRLYNGAQVNYDAKVTQVVVTEHQYMEGGDEENLFEGTAAEGDIITFDDPMYDLTPSGLTILESGANYAKVSAGTGTLTGRKYIHNTREVARAVSQANEPNVITVTDATLVSLVNSVAVAERLVNYYQWTETIESGVVYDGELPGNRSNAWHPYDEEVVSGCLESADVNLSNTLKAEERLLVGYVPPKFEQVVTYDEHELLTGSGTWTVPDGVTEAQIVLIQGGQAGYNGSDGEDGGGGGSFVRQDVDSGPFPDEGQSESRSASITAQGGSAGNGGEGGQAGTAGKVYQTTVTLTPGQSISYSCGTGGASNGATGGETIFGQESSASGGVLPAGYADIVTGIIYALPGKAGDNGGNGGSNGAYGESIGDTSGGKGVSSDSGRESDTYRLTGRYVIEGTGSYNHGGAGGGGAGGQSSGTSGESGGNANGSYFTFAVPGAGANVEGEYHQIRGGNGGDGASGSSGTTYGSAGSGGGGGGGGGAAGNVTVSVNGTIEMLGNVSGGFSVRARAYPPSGGAGGTGGAGGAGADGCIILYYGVQKETVSGPMKTSNGKILLDKLGRLMVV